MNFEKVLKESSAGKMTQKQLKAKWTELQQKLDAEKKSVEDMSLAFERESLVLSPEKKRDRQREIRDKITDLKKLNADYTEEFQILQNQRINQIQKDVFEISNTLGKEQGFLLIVERKTAGVIYMPAQVDITEQIIKKYNAQFAQKK
ncbi:MAG: OmpH family outer membrane protein [Desulfobacterales bacterium]|nr:OmpH family outer membrane protein [Desulfobacterales bacterium]